MSTSSVAMPTSAKDRFHLGQILVIISGHFAHDAFAAFLAPLLPLITDKLALSLTVAGTLTLFLRLPSLLNPFLGYIADRAGVRALIVLAPLVTAGAMSAIGLAPSYTVLALLLLLAGISSASFHAPAPAMVARLAGRRLGTGMSLFMAAGETGRALGPLLAVAAVSWWQLEGMWRVMVIGLAASLLLLWRLQSLPPQHQNHQTMALDQVWLLARRLYPVLAAIMLPRTFMVVALNTYLPLFMTRRGASLWLAGGALSILEAAGIVGALLGGTVSDRLGRRQVLTAVMGLAPLLLLLFLSSSGWMLFPVLLVLGLITFSSTPVLLAVVQEQFPDNRALANGLFITLSFMINGVATVSVGYLGDRLGLTTAYVISAGIAWLSLPMIWRLPASKKDRQPSQG